MLRERHVAGVWGNHDFVLCRNVDDRYLARPVLGYMAGTTHTLTLACEIDESEQDRGPGLPDGGPFDCRLDPDAYQHRDGVAAGMLVEPAIGRSPSSGSQSRSSESDGNDSFAQ
jgi:hypothetical protein